MGLDGKRRVLIVEDDFLIADDAQLTLTEAGFEVTGVDVSPRLVIADSRQADDSQGGLH